MPVKTLVPLAAVMLAGCAVTQIDANVHTMGTWPPGRAPGSFAFERLPSQQARPQEQARLEAAAAPALLEAGFRPAGSEPADVMVQLAERSVQGWMPDPFFSPWGGMPPWYGPRWRGGWWGAGGWGPWGPGWGWGYGIGGAVPVSWTEVSVLMLDARSQMPLYESRAQSEGPPPDEVTRAALFAAALKDFPFNAVSPRRVTVELPKPGP